MAHSQKCEELLNARSCGLKRDTELIPSVLPPLTYIGVRVKASPAYPLYWLPTPFRTAVGSCHVHVRSPMIWHLLTSEPHFLPFTLLHSLPATWVCRASSKAPPSYCSIAAPYGYSANSPTYSSSGFQFNSQYIREGCRHPSPATS